MDRRSFLYSSSVAALSNLILPANVAQAQGLNRAAVVIGVSKVGTLDTLNSTVPGAELMAEFLEQQGYTVRIHTDGSGRPVTVRSIQNDVAELIRNDNLDQLVVYFSGHGIRMAYRGEMWLLSDAQSFTSEAINLIKCSEICRYSRVKNIVFISDACRSTATSLSLGNIDGVNIFPSLDGDGADVKIDKLFAALPGNPTYEVKVSNSVDNYRSLYTDALLAAFLDPDETMVETVQGERVVPNANLDSFLKAETKRLAIKYNVIQNVKPDAEINSHDGSYIGKEWKRASLSEPLPRWVQHVGDRSVVNMAAAEATPRDGYELVLIEKGVPLRAGMPDVTQESLSEQTAEIYSRISREWLTPEPFLDLGHDATAGIACYGLPYDEVITYPDVPQERRDGAGPDRIQSITGLQLEENGASALVIFHDRSSVVVPVFKEYVTHIFRSETDVEGVSFEPLPERQYLPNEMRVDLAELRALVTKATANGVFVFTGQQSERNELARKFADRIREYKAVDPTLGVLAAYAYAYAYVPEQVASVRMFMLRDLDIPIFDVELLNRPSRPDGDPELPQFDMVPFLPMVRAGWELLGVKGLALPPEIAQARAFLRDALWTSFDPPGTEIIQFAIENGL